MLYRKIRASPLLQAVTSLKLHQELSGKWLICVLQPRFLL